jgi:hypothetical protein
MKEKENILCPDNCLFFIKKRKKERRGNNFSCKREKKMKNEDGYKKVLR